MIVFYQTVSVVRISQDSFWSLLFSAPASPISLGKLLQYLRDFCKTRLCKSWLLRSHNCKVLTIHGNKNAFVWPLTNIQNPCDKTFLNLDFHNNDKKNGSGCLSQCQGWNFQKKTFAAKMCPQLSGYHAGGRLSLKRPDKSFPEHNMSSTNFLTAFNFRRNLFLLEIQPSVKPNGNSEACNSKNISKILFNNIHKKITQSISYPFGGLDPFEVHLQINAVHWVQKKNIRIKLHCVHFLLASLLCESF